MCRLTALLADGRQSGHWPPTGVRGGPPRIRTAEVGQRPASSGSSSDRRIPQCRAAARRREVVAALVAVDPHRAVAVIAVDGATGSGLVPMIMARPALGPEGSVVLPDIAIVSAQLGDPVQVREFRSSARRCLSTAESPYISATMSSSLRRALEI